MHALMCLQSILPTKDFITYITGKITISSMYALMFLHTTPLPE
jgi:hypothetical protein